MNPKCRKSNYKHDNLNDQLLKVKHFRLPSLPGTVLNKLTQKKTFGMSQSPRTERRVKLLDVLNRKTKSKVIINNI